MSTEENKKTARRMTEEPWNEGKLDVLDEICDASYHLEGFGGIAVLKQAIAEYRRALQSSYLHD